MLTALALVCFFLSLRHLHLARLESRHATRMWMESLHVWGEMQRDRMEQTHD